MFNFKGLTCDSQGLKERNPIHTILPPIEAKTIELPSMHGGFDFGRRYGMREIEIEVYLTSTSYENMRTKVRDIAKWLNSSKLEKLYFSDEPDKYYMARLVDSSVLDELYLYGETTLKFLCPMPFAISNTNATGTLTSGGTKQVTLQGSIESYPIFTITFTASKSSYSISCGDYLIDLADNFAIGDVVVVNCETGKITVNGSTRQNILTLVSDLIVFKDGANDVTCDSGANVTYSYKQRWL